MLFRSYILQSEKRDALCKYLKEKGMATGIYYPVPMHLQKVYKPLGYKKGDLKNSEYLADRTFCYSDVCRIEGRRKRIYSKMS